MKMPKNKAEMFASGLKYSKDGLVPVAVTDAYSSELLLLAYANKDAVVKTLQSGYAWFFSRARGKLWKKGEISGNTMRILGVGIDCDKDALQYLVCPSGNACHIGRRSCFVAAFGDKAERLPISKLSSIIEERAVSRKRASYTAKLLKNKGLACAKVKEEASELAQAILTKPKKEVIWEASDLVYHLLVAARTRGVLLQDIERELAKRNKAKEKQ